MSLISDIRPEGVRGQARSLEFARWSEGDRAVMTLPLRIAGYDVDVAGVVNNAVYVRWLEDLRTGFMARWLSFEQALARGLAPTLVRIEVDYRTALG